MIVVSNTSPITNLAAIGRLDLLQRLFGRIDISDAVWDELGANGTDWPGRAEVARSAWIRRHPISADALVMTLQRSIDWGESETISLALRIKAGLVLLDDRDAREMAAQLGLKVSGVLGVLVQAKRAGHLLRVAPVIDALREQAGFHVSEAVRNHALALAAE